MNSIHKRRLYYISFLLVGLALAMGFILYALKQNLNFFLTPQQLSLTERGTGYHFRLGGMVKVGSIRRDKDSLGVHFTVTDLKQEVTVYYQGILPDLFREGKGVIAEGELNSQGIFIANQILAKHDENYMPKNVYRALREQT